MFSTFLSITQDLNIFKKNPKHSFVDIIAWKTCAKFHQKLLNSLVVEARRKFQFFRQIISFLEHNRALSRFTYRILHYLNSIIKL